MNKYHICRRVLNWTILSFVIESFITFIDYFYLDQELKSTIAIFVKVSLSIFIIGALLALLMGIYDKIKN